MPPPPPPNAAQIGAPAAPSATNHRESVKPSTTPKQIPAYPNGAFDEPPLQQNHQRLVFTDPVALRYLEEDPSTIVLHRRMTLQGYESYIVEQWACSRIHPTFIITTYTGDPSHTVVAGILSVPTDESTWSPRLKLYFNAVVKCHGRKQDTPLGTLMVTDLSTFPSSLSVIPVPSGDLKKHRDDFIVNENLKRLGCAGRAGLKLQPPPPATEAKFYQLYRTSERVTLYSAVVELVKQCQMALMMFDKLAPEYVDGLLCDVTEAAINDWWTDIGIDLFNIEPNDGVLGPTTVAAVLGTLLGARNRLHAFGAPVAKDAFDTHNLKRGVGSFQKSQKMKRTRRLDRQTLDKLHRVTAKAANAEGWTDAVKSTMAELSGQGGEMVMGMVRGRDKAGIADIETLDIDNFPHLVTGERAKWLWRGKPRKSGIEGFANGPPTADMMFTTDDQGRYVWTSRKRHSNEDFATDPSFQFQYPERSWKQYEPTGVSHEKGKTVFKGVSEKVSDARIGFGRFKDAVGLPGLRSHHHRPLRDGVDFVGDAAYIPSIDSEAEQSDMKQGVAYGNQIGHDPVYNTPHEERGEPLKSPAPELKPPEITVDHVSSTNQESNPPQEEPASHPDDEEQDLERIRSRSTEVSTDRRDQQIPRHVLMSLRRPRSCVDLRAEDDPRRKDDSFPRNLSFSNVEEVILGWESVGSSRKPGQDKKPNITFEEAVAKEDMYASDARLFCSRVLDLDQNTVPWVERQVDSVDELNRILDDRHEDINYLYLEQLGDYKQVRERSADILTDEHSYLMDNMKRVELLGAKMDYELNVLGSKVDEAETGVGEFERHVTEMETRVKTLIQGEEEKQSNSWLSWFGRVSGFSTAQ